jgi:hypothetical protein
MAVTKGQPILQSEMDDLADLANANMAGYSGLSYVTPFYRPFQFSYFDDSIDPPENVVGVDYASGELSAGTPHAVRIHSYKTISGRKHYSRAYATGYFTIISGGVDWTWDAPATGADGYILLNSDEYVLPGTPLGSNRPFSYWTEVTTNSFTDPGYSSPWTNQGDLFVSNILDPNYNPVTAGPWVREMGLIKDSIYNLITSGDVVLTDDFLCSGPWCVAVGHRLVSNLGYNSGTGATEQNVISHYKDIEFWYPASAHSGSVTVTRESYIESTGPHALHPITSAAMAANTWVLCATGLASAKTVTAKFILEYTADATSWSHTMSVISGAATITSETWTDLGYRLECAFVINLPSGDSEINIVASNATGSRTFNRIFAGAALDTTSLSPSDADVLHPESLGKKIVWGSGLATTGQVTSFWNGNSNIALRAEDIDGVWVAKTLPVVGELVFLENSLPQFGAETASYYINFGTEDLPSPRAPVPLYEIEADGTYLPGAGLSDNFIFPSVANKPSVWPVFRDTEWLTWRAIKNRGKSPVPFYNNGFPSSFYGVIVDGTRNGSVFVPANGTALRIIVSGNAPVRLYYSTVDYPDPLVPASYEGFTDTGTIKVPEDFTIATGQNVFYTITSVPSSPALSSVDIKTMVFVNYPFYDAGLKPVFFLRDSLGRGEIETFSYSRMPGTDVASALNGPQSRPLSGYCVTRVVVRRSPVDGKIPTTGEPSLSFSIGVMHGTDIDTAGTFVSLATGTIAADSGEEEIEVFWPVLEGTPLAYQCDEALEIMPFANFQPALISDFVREGSGNTNHVGRYCGRPWMFSSGSPCIRFLNRCEKSSWPSYLDNYVSLPPTASTYNEIETLLGLI